jgi:hypothetical protein
VRGRACYGRSLLNEVKGGDDHQTGGGLIRLFCGPRFRCEPPTLSEGDRRSALSGTVPATGGGKCGHRCSMSDGVPLKLPD